ncbi:hypothetical protein [Flavobacterium beibuense]|uniref:hypothetical protein n=1 Tax=Flavobacterium beibuense TaxID=657326 RepID=UPI003A8E6C49
MKNYYSEKIHDVLEYIKLRTHLVLTSKSISALENYITGYMMFGRWGFYKPELIYNEGDVDLNEFRFWTQGLPYIELSQGPRFSKFLLEKTGGDEEKAFNLFYELLEKFKEIKSNQT